MIDLARLRQAHLLGIGGIGMSGVARLLLADGIRVTGCDVKDSSITRALRAEGAEVVIGHDVGHLDALAEGELAVHSTAVPKTNPEREAAAQRGVGAHRSELLAALVERRESVGVTGTHGKGTVSAMITRILDAAGLEPGFCIGGMLLDYGTNARDGGGRLLVAEVDESDGSQLRVRPNHVVLHFLELDHLNYYDGLDDIMAAATRFVEGNPAMRTLALNTGCSGIRTLAEGLSDGVLARTVTYALDGPGDWQGTVLEAGPRSVSLEVSRRGERLGSLRLPVPGEHNAENALAAVALCAEAFDVPFGTAAEALGDFHGLENRFTIVDVDGVTLVKDYLSHPTGMRKVLGAARRLGKGRLIVVYKPYRFTLLRYLGDEYAEAFDLADEVVLTNLYTAGEEPIEGIGDDYLPNKCRALGQRVTHLEDTAAIPGFLDGFLEPGDVVALFGGDDFFAMADAFAAARAAG